MAKIGKTTIKGKCQHCSGDGFERDVVQKQDIRTWSRKSATHFDINKCSECGGTGLRVEIE